MIAHNDNSLVKFWQPPLKSYRNRWILRENSWGKNKKQAPCSFKSNSRDILNSYPQKLFLQYKNDEVVSFSNQSEFEESNGRPQAFYQKYGLGDQAELLHFYLLQFYIVL